MDKEAKQILSVLIVAALAFLMYYGSYLPYAKSASLINTMGLLQQGVNLQQFETDFQNTLNIPSPVGQYEVIKQMDMTIQSTLTNQTSVPEVAAQQLLNFALQYTQPVINSGTGGNFSQNFLVIGDIYRIMGEHYNNVADINKAIQYYQEGLKYSPLRPEFLYGELTSYLDESDNVNALKVADQILTYWPTDQNVQKVVAQIKAAPVPSFKITPVKK